MGAEFNRRLIVVQVPSTCDPAKHSFATILASCIRSSCVLVQDWQMVSRALREYMLTSDDSQHNSCLKKDVWVCGTYGNVADMGVCVCVACMGVRGRCRCVACVGVWHVWVCGYLDDICNS